MPEHDETARSMSLLQTFIDARFEKVREQIIDVRKMAEETRADLYRQPDGLVYRVKGLESSIKMLCGVLRWSAGIAGVLLAAFLLFFFSEMYRVWHAYDSLKPLIEQSDKLKR